MSKDSGKNANEIRRVKNNKIFILYMYVCRGGAQVRTKILGHNSREHGGEVPGAKLSRALIRVEIKGID